MIPYVEWTHVQLGPVAIQVWGTMVALGLLVGAWVSARFAQKRGLESQRIYQGAVWIILSAFVGARLMHVFAYEPAYYLQQATDILKVWKGGFSWIGGLVGSIVGYILFVVKHRLPWLQYVDAFMFGLPIGIGCGRIGCFLVHDHPGTLTNFVLGVRYPDGVRHDHGLYLSLNGFVLALVFYFLSKRPRHLGFFAQLFLVWDGTARFFLDFLRIGDARYWGLTPAQYASIAMAISGGIWYIHSMRHSQAFLDVRANNS